MMLQFDFPKTFESLVDGWVVTDLEETSKTRPAMDISENENEFVAVAEIPGVKKEDVKITLEKNVLTVQGQRKPYEIPQDARILLNEMRMQDFTRSIRIPSEIDASNISAELENGVLMIVLPKSQDARVRTIQIK